MPSPQELATQIADLERQIKALVEIVKATDLPGTLDERLQASLEALLEAIQAPVGMIGLLDSSGLIVRIHAQAGLPEAYYAAIPPIRVDEGVIGQAIRQGEMLIGDDLAADARPAVRPHAAQHGLQAYAVVPLKVRDSVLGVIRVAYRGPHEFSPYQQTSLRLVGQQVGLFIESYRLAQAQKRRIAELESLNQISHAISSTLDLDVLLQTFYAQISRLMDTSTFLVALRDADTRTYYLPIHYDAGIAYPAGPRPLGSGLTSYVIEQGKSLLVSNMERERDSLPVKPVVAGTGQAAASWLGVPLIFGGETLGAIVIQSYQPGTYTEDDQHFLEAVADQAAIAIKNARLYAETLQRADEALSLYNIGVLLASTRDLDEILMAIYKEASQVMDTTAFSVALYDPASDEIRFELFVDQGEVIGKFSRPLAEPSLNAWIICNQQAVFVRDPQQDPFPVPNVVIAGHAWAPHSFLGVPLLYKGRAIGAITVQSQQPFAFDAHQKQVLEGIAHLAAPALENARLLGQLQSSIDAQARLLKTIEEVGTPLIPVAEGIVVLPLVGHVDQQRAQLVMETLLTGIATHQADVVLIDITGVPLVDSVVASSLLQAAQAARLLGAEVMLVGVRPEVAQTIVDLGIELQGLANFVNLRSGIEAALRRHGLHIARMPAKAR